MNAKRDGDLSAELDGNGFCLIPDALDSSIIDRLRTLADNRLADADKDHLARYSHHGSLLPLTLDDDPVPVILTSSVMRDTFHRLGFSDPRWISGYIIAKPPRSPGLWWHQDWWAWGHPRSYIRQPTQIFCMIYLEPTTRENGCLRVLPRTHLERHHLHDILPEPHTVEIENQPARSLSHEAVPGEIDITAHPGDLVIGDVRVIHATHPNQTKSRRTAIDLLFIPHFNALPNEFTAHYVRQICLPPPGWWDKPDNPLLASPLRHILPTYSGPEVRDVEFCRRPRWPDGDPDHLEQAGQPGQPGQPHRAD